MLGKSIVMLTGLMPALVDQIVILSIYSSMHGFIAL